MAVLAFKVLADAVEAVGTADGLAIKMEPHLQKRYGNSAIYAYTNQRAVPPGDVLLAAALAAGISLDEKLGLVQRQSEVERQVDELRAEMNQLHAVVAELRGQRGGADGPPVEQDAAADPGATRAARGARRREWARRSAEAQPPTQSPSGGRSTGRNRQP